MELDERVRLKVSQAYCHLRGRGVPHHQAVDKVQTELIKSAMGSTVGLSKIVAYKSAIPAYCLALRKKIEGV
jgi:hypothetical protein